MSIVRFGEKDSDVYVFESSQGLECWGCKLNNEKSFIVSDDPEKMAEHLKEHQSKNQCVPDYVFEELKDWKIGE